MDTERRPIRSEEIEVLRQVLSRVHVRGDVESLLKRIDSLYVSGGCDCGCASVDFETSVDQGATSILADAVGTTPEGGLVGLIVWGTETSITGIEVYDLGAGYDETHPDRVMNERVRLPVPESIRELGAVE